MADKHSFSNRHGFREIKQADITVRYEAPYELRGVFIALAYECNFRPKPLRTLVCRVLRKRPDSNNWAEYPNIDEEIHRLIDDAEWYEVYDIVESIVSEMNESPFSHDLDLFERELNLYFIEKGIGWKLEDGRLEVRSLEAVERTIRSATTSLYEGGNRTAQTELHEAMVDLSRRPIPDITGSVQHAMASLECVVRDVSGDHKATLGELLKRYPDMIPAPLNVALEKLWGFASEYGRHVREGRNPEFTEAQLVVGVCAAAIAYLIGKKNV